MTGSPPPAAPRLSRRAKWTVLVAGTVGVLAVMFALAEGAIRLRQALRFGTTATVERYYTIDERSGLRIPIANLRDGPIAINSLGFRGPDIAVPKPPGTVRIAFLGASTTWCAEVSDNEHVWAHLVAASLARSFPATRFDYVNAGVPGYTVESIRRNLEQRVVPLAPDVIVVYEAANNLSGELRSLAVRQGLLADTKFEETSWLGQHSLLWNLAEKNLRVLLARNATASGRSRLVLDATPLGTSFHDELTRVVATSQRVAPVVAIATFSTQLRPGQSPEQQQAALTSALFYLPFVTPDVLLRAYRDYNDVIRTTARETGALLIEGEDDIPGDPVHFADTVHFTDAGSAAMAKRVGRALEAELQARGATPR